MSALPGAPRARWVDPTVYLPLKRFSCGGTSPHETEVDDIAHKLYAGKITGASIRVAENPSTGDLLGFCGHHQRPLPPDYLDAAYVMVIAVAAGARRQRIGDFLLSDALSCIHTSWGGGAMPPVWACVAPANTKSHRLFDRHHFGLIFTSGPYQIRFRPRGITP